MAAYHVQGTAGRARGLRPGRDPCPRQRPRSLRPDGRGAQRGAAPDRGRSTGPAAWCERCGRRRFASETTTVVAVDEQGNACAATHSLGLGSGIWTGGVHGNSMLGEGELLRGELLPGERMPSMMVPLVVTDPAGGLLFAGGAAGGSRIRSALLQVLTKVAGRPARPRPKPLRRRGCRRTDAVHLEPGFGPEVIAALRAGRRGGRPVAGAAAVLRRSRGGGHGRSGRGSARAAGWPCGSQVSAPNPRRSRTETACRDARSGGAEPVSRRSDAQSPGGAGCRRTSSSPDVEASTPGSTRRPALPAQRR